jgi:hypothetical protein
LGKPFTIAGFVAGEAYMLFAVLAPNLKGTTVPWGAMVERCLIAALFFGPFGGAVGLGAWMLFQALKQGFTGGASSKSDDE